MPKDLTRSLKRLSVIFAAAALMTAGCSRHHKAPDAPGAQVTHTDTGETCVKISDTKSFSLEFPQLYKIFQKISSLPLTGSNVTAVVGAPEMNYSTCTVPSFDRDGVRGDFTGTKLRVLEDDPDERAYVHEMFHAAQQANGSLNLIGSGKFSVDDEIAGNMLMEASAVGYSFAAYKEMSKTDPDAYENFANSAYAFEMRGYFDAAYDDAEAKYAGLPANDREAKALEAGGRAVVDALLQGANKTWSFNYAVTSAYNNARAAIIPDRNEPHYAAARDRMYFNAGAVSPKINLTPRALLASNTADNVTTYLGMNGITIGYTR